MSKVVENGFLRTETGWSILNLSTPRILLVCHFFYYN